MKYLLRRVLPFGLPAGGFGMVVLIVLYHVAPILADGPLKKYGSDRALKEQVAPVDVQRILAALVRR